MFKEYELKIKLNKLQNRFKSHLLKINALISTIDSIENKMAKEIVFEVILKYKAIKLSQ